MRNVRYKDQIRPSFGHLSFYSRELSWSDPNLTRTTTRPDETDAMNADIFLENNRRMLVSFCRENHIIRISLFGSALRGEATTNSDIDLLVEFHPQHMPGLIKLAGMEIELSHLLGKKVDLRTAQDLSVYFRDEVLREAKEAYAET